MKWLRTLPDSLIRYVADRMYDRIKSRALDDLEPYRHIFPASLLFKEGK